MRWLMLLILFLVRLAMGFQFQSVASTSAQLIDAFGLSYAQVGTLIGLFLLPGVFIAIPSGALTRAISDKNLLMLGAVTMTVGAYVMGSAADATELYAGRLITGVGGTIFNVILTKMVTEWFFEKEIVPALAIMLTAWPIGIALGLLIHNPVAAAYGWNSVMYVTALAALAALLLTALFYRAPPAPLDLHGEPLRYGLPMRQLVHTSVVGVAWTLYNAAFILVVSFMPGALISLGYERGAASSVTSLFMWTMMVSVPIGGRLLQSTRHVTLALAALLLASSAMLVVITTGTLPEAGLVLVGIISGIPAGALMSLSAEAVSRENRGPGLGIFYTWYYLGMTLMPVLAGWLRDWTGSAKAPVLLAALLMASVVACVALLRTLQARWRIDERGSGVSAAAD
ncbi:MAG TPA: MFS transporter [Burkholderiales bacterium]|nr:MFS transporter [Burkholderiales bacterium]